MTITFATAQDMFVMNAAGRYSGSAIHDSGATIGDINSRFPIQKDAKLAIGVDSLGRKFVMNICIEA